jgi:polysaccharide deacetylase family protein (PEP-CTERM system associated)
MFSDKVALLPKSVEDTLVPTQLSSSLATRSAVRTESVPPRAPSIILSFDVEEHYRIEAASGLSIPSEMVAHCQTRLDWTTRWLLDQLAPYRIRATFFVVGQIADSNPDLVKAIARAGHEIASHGWDHQRVHRFTPTTFREDLQKSKDTLEHVAGTPVVGYRAPTFSITRETAWGIDVLAEAGFLYDSSIYPVRHDRYGIPQAPRTPFVAQGHQHSILELPPATLRLLGLNAPMGGGGYFRFFPLWFTRWAIAQMSRTPEGVAMLYFHPWEFDVAQRQLPMRWSKRFRTYVGIAKTQERLSRLLSNHDFSRAIDVVRSLQARAYSLPCFSLRAEREEEVFRRRGQQQTRSFD